MVGGGVVAAPADVVVVLRELELRLFLYRELVEAVFEDQLHRLIGESADLEGGWQAASRRSGE